MRRDAPALASARPALLFYCQHSLGIGHLTRSFALASALAGAFRVVFLNGGRLPPGLPVPSGIEIIDLPPLGMDDGHTVVSRGALLDVAQVKVQRRALIEAAVRVHRPAVLLVELFPFGRKKFADEILPLIRLVRTEARHRNGQARVVCSLRDILVDARPDQQQHDDRARWLTDRCFDAVLVHADPALVRLEHSFRPRQALRTPVHYTGYVVPLRAVAAAVERSPHLLVSAGGGIVGQELFQAALQARLLMREPPPMRLIAGPFLPEADWRALQQAARGMAGVALVRQVGDMVAEMRQARASVSQCGYNTALDILVSRVPALVLPYATVTENEQSERAAKLAALGALLQLQAPAEAPSFGPPAPARLAAAITELLRFKPNATALALDGAATSADTVQRLCEAGASCKAA